MCGDIYSLLDDLMGDQSKSLQVHSFCFLLNRTAEVVDQLDIVEKIRDLIDSLNELMRMVKPNLEDLQVSLSVCLSVCRSVGLSVSLFNSLSINCMERVIILKSISDIAYYHL